METLPFGRAEGVVERLLEGCDDEFVLHARAELVALGIHVVVENVALHVAQVLVAQRGEKFQRPFLPIGVLLYEVFDDPPVAPCLYNIRCSVGMGIAFHALLAGEGGDVGVADGVFEGEAAVVFLALCRRDRGQVGLFRRRDDVDFLACQACGLVVIEFDGDAFVLAERSLGIAEAAVLRRPDEHVALARREKGLSLGVGVFGSGRVELGVIVDFEVHARVVHGLAVAVHHLEVGPCRTAVVVDQVDFGEVARPEHDLLRPAIVAEGAGVHQHGSRCRCVEPAKVQYGFGFARS